MKVHVKWLGNEENTATKAWYEPRTLDLEGKAVTTVTIMRVVTGIFVIHEWP